VYLSAAFKKLQLANTACSNKMAASFCTISKECQDQPSDMTDMVLYENTSGAVGDLCLNTYRKEFEKKLTSKSWAV
jgi:hypothetical protein